MCLGFEPRAAGWKAQTNQLSYGEVCIIKLNIPGTAWNGRDKFQ